MSGIDATEAAVKVAKRIRVKLLKLSAEMRADVLAMLNAEFTETQENVPVAQDEEAA